MISILLILLVHFIAAQGSENNNQNSRGVSNLTQLQNPQEKGSISSKIWKKLEALKRNTAKPFDDDKPIRTQELTTQQGMNLMSPQM